MPIPFSTTFGTLPIFHYSKFRRRVALVYFQRHNQYIQGKHKRHRLVKFEHHSRIISPKNAEGLVNIKGELWTAESAEDNISPGEKVDVVGEDGMKLVVSRKQVKK